MKPSYLSLQPFILWRQVERPIRWAERFGREFALEVEIGFGNGEFLVQSAREHPERDFVGIEVEWASVQRALRKLAQAEVSNVRLLLADARVAFERLFLPQSVGHIYSLFPCPWPKKRHAKHRLFAHEFLKLLNSRLIEGGEVEIVTDYQPYLEWVLQQVPDTGFETQLELTPPRFNTRYERKWRGQGVTLFYRLRLQKQIHIEIPLKEDVPVETYRVPTFDPDRFQPIGERGEITVEFKEFLYDPARRKGMVRVIVAEETLKQDFWIEIAEGADGWHIRPAHGCGVVPTVGVQRALDRVRDAVS